MDNIYLPKPAHVIDAYPEADNSAILTLKMKDWSRFKFRAGQFAMVGFPGWGEAPFDICSSPLENKIFQFCIRRVGSLTEKLAGLKRGDECLVRGPLGNGFDYLAKLEPKNLLFLGGGCGFVTVRPIMKEIIARELYKDRKIQVFYGARAEENILFAREQEEWAEYVDVKIILENPPAQKNGRNKRNGRNEKDKGDEIKSIRAKSQAIADHSARAESKKYYKGLITDLFKQVEVVSPASIIMCGPPVMYRFCIQRLGLKCLPESTYLLMERRMHCGVGLCEHCALGPYYVCKDGPVFTLEQLYNADVVV